jgi:hypothetical protein
MRSYLRKIGTYIFIILGLIISLLIVLLLILFIRYPDEYIVRVLKWRDADVYDYMKFPERILEPPPETFIFTENIDESYIRQAFREAAAVADLDAMLRDTKTQAFIVIKNDTLLYEKYFNNTQRHSIVTSFSVAKSFASALVGKAIDEGYLSDVNDPITKYIPELAKNVTGDSRNITIRHLIMMSTGIKYTRNIHSATMRRHITIRIYESLQWNIHQSNDRRESIFTIITIIRYCSASSSSVRQG